MQKFYNDKSKLFECNLSIDGADVDETSARLVLQFPNNRNLLFYGNVDRNGKCEVKIPALRELKESKGKAILEVIAESTYFESWSDDFELKASKTVVVEMIEPKKIVESEEVKPKVTVIQEEVVEKKIIKEEPKDKKVVLEQFAGYVNDNNITFKEVIKDNGKLNKLINEFNYKYKLTKSDVEYLTESIKKLIIIHS